MTKQLAKPEPYIWTEKEMKKERIFGERNVNKGLGPEALETGNKQAREVLADRG